MIQQEAIQAPDQDSISDRERVVTYQLAIGNGKIKNQRLPASLLLEGLIALAMFGVLTILVLGELGDSRQQRLEELRQGEVLHESQKNGDPDKAGSIEHQSGQCPGERDLPSP